ncbi:hypothetical protein ACFVAD_19335 [Sutcliffiella sp. NPDC057660]|uniref:hypothetical protein n=1 Tax=Sutcliffiella sp. NPDC057660 TaxID=3346199 RepID=UPI00367D42F4
MNRLELSKKMKQQINGIVKRNGYVSFIEVLLSLEKLSQDDYQNWRKRRITYLERVVRGNLGQLNFMIKEYRSHCLQMGWKPSFTVYNSWGKGNKKLLRFSKSGNKHVEAAYATHYVRKSE